jgi:hypothetical protein
MLSEVASGGIVIATTRLKVLHTIHASISFLLFLLIGSVMSHAQAVTEDLSEPRSFTFRIAPSVPSFTFKLTPLRKSPDEFGNPQSTIRQIQVFRAGSKVPLQDLSGCDLEEMAPPGSGAEFFWAKDFNFDGYKDIFLETGHGATGNLSGCVWLYDPTTGQFNYNQEFSNLSRFWLDRDTKTIFTFQRGGMLSFIHVAERYAIRNKHLVLIWSQNQDWDIAQNKLHCIVKERVGEEMVVVRDVWSDVDDKNPPCNPSKLPWPREE